MSGKRRDDHYLRHHSYSHEDLDHQYALRLSAELNGDLGGHIEAAKSDAAAKQQLGYDHDYDLAPRMQYVDEDWAKTYCTSAAASQQETSWDMRATTVDIEGDAARNYDLFSSFRAYLKTTGCAKCGHHFLDSESYVARLFKEWYGGKQDLSTLLKCGVCGSSSCVSCQSTTFSARMYLKDKSASWCCSEGQLLTIWILLCGFDLFYREAKINSDKAEAAKKTQASQFKNASKGKGKARADRDNGVGYGGYGEYHNTLPSISWDDVALLEEMSANVLSLPASKIPKPKSQSRATGSGETMIEQLPQVPDLQSTLDMLARTVLGLLTHLLPSLGRRHQFDVSPPEVLPSLLLESKVLEYCSEVLRNHSLDDFISRSNTYDAVLDFVEVVGLYPMISVPAIYSERPEQDKLCTLLTKTYGPAQPAPTATTPSIADSLRDLSKLTGLYLKSMRSHAEAYDPKSDGGLLQLCRKTSELWITLELVGHLPTCKPESSNTTTDTPDTLNTPSKEVANIRDITDEQMHAMHAFTPQAQTQTRSAHGRIKRLVFEMNMLKTSLPPNIFVRYGESRLDLMKCVIIGPKGTPYENGLFEFDIYCPGTYPNVPPQVSFKGTGGGLHGINPNLYSNGTVCLSLLGTWSGEPWKPGVSTLLQLLVSLQAMIFCEEPWYNEPGMEARSKMDDSPSVAYNYRVRKLTVRLAMLDWLEEISPTWADVVEQHFRSNADAILHTVIDWGTQPKPTIPAARRMVAFYEKGFGESYDTMLPKLHHCLQTYGATVALPSPLPSPEVAEPQAKRPCIPSSKANGEDVSDELGLQSDQDMFQKFGAEVGSFPHNTFHGAPGAQALMLALSKTADLFGGGSSAPEGSWPESKGFMDSEDDKVSEDDKDSKDSKVSEDNKDSKDSKDGKLAGSNYKASRGGGPAYRGRGGRGGRGARGGCGRGSSMA